MTVLVQGAQVVNVAGERTLENSAQVPPVLPHPLAVWPQASDLISLISQPLHW